MLFRDILTDEFYVFDVYERLGRGIYVNHSIQKRRKSAPPTIINGGNEKIMWIAGHSHITSYNK